MRYFKAIAAMSLNRVIGAGNRIPWHYPEDFKWFREQTLGNIVVMGRKTFESLGKPLANRRNLILTRHPRQLIRRHPAVFGPYREWRGGKDLKRQPYQLRLIRIDGNRNEDIRIFSSLRLLDPAEFADQIFICGGAQIYEQLLPQCSDLFLTLVKRECAGDAFFPAFEDRFVQVRQILDTPEFEILHYRHRLLHSLPASPAVGADIEP
jgi:dihydrofolate reductase